MFNMDTLASGEAEVLLVQRGKPPSQGLYSLPGGRLRLGETIAAGTVREVWEETGLRVARMGPVFTAVDVITGVAEDVGEGREGPACADKGRRWGNAAATTVDYHYVVIDSLAFARGTPSHAGDAADARWVTAAHCTALLPCHDGLQQVVDGALDMVRAGLGPRE